MKNLNLIVLAAVFASAGIQGAWACGEKASAEEAKACKSQHAMVMTSSGEKAAEGIAKATFEVKGMTCDSCRSHIREALMKVEGVKGVTFVKKVATVEYTEAQVKPEILLSAIQGAGYEATAPEAKTKKN
jgi:copper chaperone